MSSSEGTVVALHGFTQGGAMWDEVAAASPGRWVTPDLPFHGGPPVSDWDGALAWLSGTVAAVPRPRILAGYSMGGRLALAAAAADAPIDGLLIVAASPGIDDAGAREARREADESLARRIEADGVTAFLDGWLSLPMFSGLGARSDRWRADDRAVRERHDERALAASLRILGQAAQPGVLEALGGIEAPVDFVVGEIDERYRSMADAMAARVSDATVTVVPGAGHPVVGEQPSAVAGAVAALWARVVDSEHMFD